MDHPCLRPIPTHIYDPTRLKHSLRFPTDTVQAALCWSHGQDGAPPLSSDCKQVAAAEAGTCSHSSSRNSSECALLLRSFMACNDMMYVLDATKFRAGPPFLLPWLTAAL